MSVRHGRAALTKSKKSHDLPHLGGLSLNTGMDWANLLKRQRSRDDQEERAVRQRQADEADVLPPDDDGSNEQGDIKAVIFDWDGTLTNMRPVQRNAPFRIFDAAAPPGAQYALTSATSLEGYLEMNKDEHVKNMGGRSVLDGDRGLAALLAQGMAADPPVEFYIIDPDAKQEAVLHALRVTDMIGFFSKPGTTDGARVFCSDVPPFSAATDTVAVHNWHVIEKIMKREIGDLAGGWLRRTPQLRQNEVLYIDDKKNIIMDTMQGVRNMGIATINASVVAQWSTPPDSMQDTLWEAIIGRPEEVRTQPWRPPSENPSTHPAHPAHRPTQRLAMANASPPQASVWPPPSVPPPVGYGDCPPSTKLTTAPSGLNAALGIDAGLGLFATEDIAEDEVFAEFQGPYAGDDFRYVGEYEGLKGYKIGLPESARRISGVRVRNVDRLVGTDDQASRANTIFPGQMQRAAQNNLMYNAFMAAPGQEGAQFPDAYAGKRRGPLINDPDSVYEATRFYIVAINEIKAGEEIFVVYGDQYEQDD